MNYKVMKSPMFRLGGDVRKNYENGTGLEEIENLIKQRAAQREKFTNFRRGVMPLQVLAGQPGLQTIRKPTDVLSILSDIGQDPNLFNALIKSRSLDLDMKEKDLKDKITLAKLRKDSEGSSIRMKSEQAIRRIQKNIQKLESMKKDESDETKLGIINNRIKTEKAALRAYYNDDMRLRAYEILKKAQPYQEPTEEQILQTIKSISGNAEGGSPIDRTNFQQGTPEPMMKETISVEETLNPVKEQPQESSMSVKQMYDLMRQRIPVANVSDKDLYKIASSQQIMADFASLETMSDVTQFNEQYDTNIVLDLPIVG